ncbi:metallophosphoesterase family protein [Paenibacillus turpanensis]|uniref:metallophosphoesterase family protein n=1 Tax=Paenibacillus turpanensis TaxID=2689078 RepID=UPI00140C3BEA|nr:metallophosphoesterase family protein [Paenibacillus turpanensis]
MPQKIAVISDIHSNRFALEAVLKNISDRGIQTIVNLGDSLFGPIDPLGTAKLLMENENMIHIMGNCDQLLLERENASPTYQFVKPRIHREVEDWLRSFRKKCSIDNILFCHGTPHSNEQYMLEEVGEKGARYKEADQLTEETALLSESYVVCGHSHVFRSVYLPNGKMIVNAGSVGLPAYYDECPYPHVMESGSPYAVYLIATEIGERLWGFEHVMLPYDWKRASAAARANGREDYAYAIETGRAMLI